MSLDNLIDSLRILADGCSKHPAYRGKRKPLSDCQRCHLIWDLRSKLTAVEYADKDMRWGGKW